MAIVIKAYVLCATDSQDAAEQAVYSALNGGVFETASPILDFAACVEQVVPLSPDYEDGSFVRMIPAASLLQTANPMTLPC